jgi:hypothetical protein
MGIIFQQTNPQTRGYSVDKPEDKYLMCPTGTELANHGQARITQMMFRDQGVGK